MYSENMIWPIYEVFEYLFTYALGAERSVFLTFLLRTQNICLLGYKLTNINLGGDIYFLSTSI